MNHSNSKRGTAALLAVISACLLPAAVNAQDDEDSLLEEIITTAERREASVQEVPVAVSAFSEAAIEKLQINETLDLVNVVPNLFGGNNTGLGTANMYYLRAQGNDESIATFDPPVGTYVDDVYITRQNANNFAFFDVERIEVLRGPQGTLFGRNTTGGAVNIIMKKPAEEMGGYIEAGFGSYDEVLLRASVDAPFSDTFMTKFSAYWNEDDGWLDNSVDGKTYNDKSNYGVRAAFRFIPNDDLTWDLSIENVVSDEANVLGQPISGDRISTSILPGGLPDGLGVQKASYGNETDSLNITSNLAWALGAGTASFIVGYRDLEQDFLLNFPGFGNDDFFWIDNNGEHEMLTVELKWNAQLMDGRLDLVTGAFFLDEDNKTDFADYIDFFFLGLPVGSFFQLADRVMSNSTESWAAYIQGDIAVGEKGTLTLGARYTDEQKDIGYVDNTGNDFLTTANMIAAGVPVKQSESNITPRIAYAHQFSDDVMGYVSATNGFKSGGWNAREGNPANVLPFGPEEIWSYEAGVRADWAGGRLRTNLTVFQTDLEDLQTTSATPSGSFLTTNAGGLDVTGVELDLTALPTDNWEIFLSLGLQDPKYVDLPEGCTVPNTDFAAFDANCNVADPKRSPEETATLSTSFEIPIGKLTLRPTISARYIGKNVVGTRQLGENGSETLLNATVALMDNNGRWMATVECKNCSDERYVTSYLFGPYWTPPRTYQARLRYNFGAR